MLFLEYCSKQDDQSVFLSWTRKPSVVSRYTQDPWELKSVVVLSNAQPSTRVLLIYYRLREVPFYIPQGYMKGRLIYQWYTEEMHDPQAAMQVINDNSYA